MMAQELSVQDWKEDLSRAHKSHGCIREVDVMRSTGDLNFVSIYSSIGCKISAAEVRGISNPQPSLTVQEIWYLPYGYLQPLKWQIGH